MAKPMANPMAKRDHLSGLLPELLLYIASCSEEMYSADDHQALLCALSSTSRLEMELYSFNINKQGASVMTLAASLGRIDFMEKALSYGAPIEAQGQHRGARLAALPRTDDECPRDQPFNFFLMMLNVQAPPLHYAVCAGRDHIIEWLLDNGASLSPTSTGLFGGEEGHFIAPYLKVNAPGFKRTIPTWLPLHLAICKGRTSIAKLLARRGADLGLGCPSPWDYWSGINRLSALQCAAKHGNGDLIRFLVREIDGTILDNKDSYGETALHVASGYYVSVDDHFTPIKAVEALGELGADLEARTNNGQTALEVAVGYTHFEAAVELIELGADHIMIGLMDVLDEDCYSQWGEGRNDLALMLAKMGADLEETTPSGTRPLVVAMGYGSSELVDTLLDLGANIEPPGYGPGESQSLVLDTLRSAYHLKTWPLWEEKTFRKLAARGIDLNALRGNWSTDKLETCLTFYIRHCPISAQIVPFEEPIVPSIISFLFELGVSPNACNGEGMSPIHCLLECFAKKLEIDIVTPDYRSKHGNEA